MPASDEIVQIFHQVTTEVPELGNVSGVLLISRQHGELFFQWKMYRTASSPPDVLEFFVKVMSLQRITVNYHETDGYISLTRAGSQPVLRFGFPSHCAFQLLQFVQVLALKAAEQSSAGRSDGELGVWVEYAHDSFVSNMSPFRVIDIPVDSGKFSFPREFSIGASPGSPAFSLSPNVSILAQYDVHGEVNVGNPVTSAELSSFDGLERLRDAIAVRGMDPEIRFLLWPVLLNVLPFKGEIDGVIARRVEEYESVRLQWLTMSKAQIKYNAAIKEAFTTIRVDVKRTYPPASVESYEEWREYLTRVLRTYAIWNFDVRYTQGFNDICIILMSIFVPQIGISITKPVSEALVFWCFAAVVEKTASGLIAEDLMLLQKTELTEIMNITKRFQARCGDWFHAKSFSDLSFLVSALILAYGRTFAPTVVPRIWETLISSSAPGQFLRYFSSSLLILSFPAFLAIEDCSIGKLMSHMDGIFRDQDIGAAIGLTLSLMKRSQAEIQTKNEKQERRRLVAFETDPAVQWLFQVNLEYSGAYAKMGPLFL
jgi:hypothetical protein